MAFDYITYMRNVAINMKAIAHQTTGNGKKFYRVSGLSSMEEVLSNLTDTNMYPAILVNDLEMGRIADEGPANNYLEKQTHIFYVVGYADLNDFAAKEKSLSDLKAIVHKIIGKMIHDSNADYKPLTVRTGMRNLDRRSFFYQVVTGIGPFCHGYMVSFEIQPSVNAELKYNEDEWTS